MRQGKLSELIHNSARYSDLDECSVEVHFREIIDLVRVSFSSNYANVQTPSGSGQPGPDAYKVVPNSNLVVARTAFKNNSSKYTINDRMSNFTERGIDLDHKQFLILQVGFIFDIPASHSNFTSTVRSRVHCANETQSPYRAQRRSP